MNRPFVSSPLAIYREHLSRGELVYQVDDSNRAIFYPRVVTPVQSSGSLNWEISQGRGTVYATTTIYPRKGSPYNVALIDMDEGFRLMSRVESVAAEDVRVGLRVKMRILHPAGDEPLYPVFDPLEAP